MAGSDLGLGAQASTLSTRLPPSNFEMGRLPGGPSRSVSLTSVSSAAASAAASAPGYAPGSGYVNLRRGGMARGLRRASPSASSFDSPSAIGARLSLQPDPVAIPEVRV